MTLLHVSIYIYICILIFISFPKRRRGNMLPCTDNRMNVNYEQIASWVGAKLRSNFSGAFRHPQRSPICQTLDHCPSEKIKWIAYSWMVLPTRHSLQPIRAGGLTHWLLVYATGTDMSSKMGKTWVRPYRRHDIYHTVFIRFVGALYQFIMCPCRLFTHTVKIASLAMWKSQIIQWKLSNHWCDRQLEPYMCIDVKIPILKFKWQWMWTFYLKTNREIIAFHFLEDNSNPKCFV